MSGSVCKIGARAFGQQQLAEIVVFKRNILQGAGSILRFLENSSQQTKRIYIYIELMRAGLKFRNRQMV